MPELPDVELFKHLVERDCLGRIVAQVDVADPGRVEGTPVSYIQKSLLSTRLRACHRYGKYLIIEFDGAGSLAMHFGPNGSLRLVHKTQPDLPHVRLSLVFSDGDRLVYLNPRRIGRVRLVESAEAFVAESGLGPDALDPSLDQAAFAAILANRRQPIKATLTDQARIAGIGNTYSDEILFHARLHPGTIAATLGPDETRRLFRSIRSVLRTAIDHEAGAEGFADRLPNGFLLPERHAGGRCPRCGTAIESEKYGGRTNYFCPACQLKPCQ
jgi:formamidopyrimidine-DNA glycosylase